MKYTNFEHYTDLSKCVELMAEMLCFSGVKCMIAGRLLDGATQLAGWFIYILWLYFTFACVLYRHVPAIIIQVQMRNVCC